MESRKENKLDNDESEISGLSELPVSYIVIFIVCVLIICSLPSLFVSNTWCGLDFTETGQIGDTIGGIMSPFIAMVAIWFTFKAFWIQYQANRLQDKAIKQNKIQHYEQHRDLERERFENRYFKMLDIYRNITSAIYIENIGKGNIAFHYMYYEFKSLYKIAERKFSAKNILIPKLELVKIAFVLFYYGITDGENYTIKQELKDRYQFNDEIMAIVEECINEVIDIQSCQKCLFVGKDKKACPKHRCSSKLQKIEKLKSRIHFLFEYLDYDQRFKIYDGHMVKLSSYFLFLMKIVDYVVSQNGRKIGVENHRDFYLEFLRAQMSSHEIILLYFYGISNFNTSFDVNKYFIEYDMFRYISRNTVSQIIDYEEAGIVVH